MRVFSEDTQKKKEIIRILYHLSVLKILHRRNLNRLDKLDKTITRLYPEFMFILVPFADCLICV